MSNLNFTSQVCTSRSQSERLLAFGLKRETADMFWSNLTEFPICHPYKRIVRLAFDLNDEALPAWSLHRLIEMMPTVITHDDYSLILGINATCVYYADDEYAETFKAFEGNLYECVVKCIEWLIKEGYFNKEYLDE